MSVEKKKVLSIIVYYTLAVLTFLAGAFFVFTVVVDTLPMWAKVIYYVWIGFVIGLVIFDIVCTCTKEAKFVSGWITYTLSLVSVLLPVILYFMNVTRTGLDPTFFNVFFSVALMSIVTSGLMIATWCVGENVVEHAVAEDKIEKRERK